MSMLLRNFFNFISREHFMLIYERIKQLCKANGVTVTGTESALGFARGSLCKIDKNKPSAEKVTKLAEYLGTTPDYLMTGKEPRQYYLPRKDIETLRNSIENMGYAVYNDFSRNYGDVLIIWRIGFSEMVEFGNDEIINWLNNFNLDNIRNMIEQKLRTGPYAISKSEDELIEEAFAKPDIRNPAYKSTLTPRDEKDITVILSNTEQLLKQPGLMFEGHPASQESIDSILSAMQIGMEIAKKKNKELYTPNKYKKEQ